MGSAGLDWTQPNSAETVSVGLDPAELGSELSWARLGITQLGWAGLGSSASGLAGLGCGANTRLTDKMRTFCLFKGGIKQFRRRYY